MKIVSRPRVKQDCEDIVLKSIEQLYMPGWQGPSYTVPTLMQYDAATKLIMRTLLIANTIGDFTMQQPKELSSSTYQNEQWLQNVGFTGDGKNWYTLELRYRFSREAPEGKTHILVY